jgi:hypothetical protein
LDESARGLPGRHGQERPSERRACR